MVKFHLYKKGEVQPETKVWAYVRADVDASGVNAAYNAYVTGNDYGLINNAGGINHSGDFLIVNIDGFNGTVIIANHKNRLEAAIGDVNNNATTETTPTSSLC